MKRLVTNPTAEEIAEYERQFELHWYDFAGLVGIFIGSSWIVYGISVFVSFFSSHIFDLARLLPPIQ